MQQATSSAFFSQLTPINVFVASAFGSGLMTFLYKIIEKIFDNISAHKNRISTDKRQIADEIMKICAEGERKAFQRKAKDNQYIIFISKQAGTFDKKVQSSLKEYQLLWELAAGTINRNAPGDLEFYREIEGKARKQGEFLLSIAQKWKK